MNLPVLRPSGKLLRRVSRLLTEQLASGAPGRLARWLRELEIEARFVAPMGTTVPGLRAPAELLLIHPPLLPERRALLLRSLSKGFEGASVLALSEAEWRLLGSLLPVELHPKPQWGELGPAPEIAPQQHRQLLLRAASNLHLEALPKGLAEASTKAEAKSCCAALRDVLATTSVASHFPPLAGPDAPVDEHCAAALGVFHAAFSAEATLPDEARYEAAAPQPVATQRTATMARNLLAPVLADLGQPARDRLLALYLAPGRHGTRHRWRLLAVLPDEAPLLEAVRLGQHLAQHMAMVDRARLHSLFPHAGAPALLTQSSLSAMMQRKLFPQPSYGTVLAQHAQLLLGEDLLPTLVPPSATLSALELHCEFASLTMETRSCWMGDRPALEVRDLLFGAWPALLHLARGGEFAAPLKSIHDKLATATDPALARVGSAADLQAWGCPARVDRSSSRELIAEWGPSLLRLQEATMEALG